MDTTPAPARFFEPKRTYLSSTASTRMRVLCVETAPPDYQHPQESGPVAFGWAQVQRESGEWVALGAWTATDFTGWTLDTSKEA